MKRVSESWASKRNVSTGKLRTTGTCAAAVAAFVGCWMLAGTVGAQTSGLPSELSPPNGSTTPNATVQPSEAQSRPIDLPAEATPSTALPPGSSIGSLEPASPANTLPALPSAADPAAASLQSTEVTPAPASTEKLVAPAPLAASKEVLPPSTAAATLPAHDLSPLGMFQAADPVVKGVMLLLAVASFATWTILLFKIGDLFAARRAIRRGITVLVQAESLAHARSTLRRGSVERMVAAAIAEVERSAGLASEGIKERVVFGLNRMEHTLGRRIASGTAVLATIGSAGPFIGLFGTVWGIMHSFIGIANSNTTSLAVVAPGIAEALLATGIGLAAAIPAVVIYNALGRAIAGYRALVADAVMIVVCHLSRDLDRLHLSSSIERHADLAQAAE